VNTYPKEQLERFLEAVDAALDEPMELIVIGGAAAALHYGLRLPTRDIDTWNAINASLAQAVKKAREVTGLVHGAADVREAEAISDKLFSGDVKSLTLEQAAQACQAMTHMEMTLGAGKPLTDVLTATGLAESKKRARELVAAGAIQVNGEPETRVDAMVSRARALHGKYLILRKGKKTYHAVVVREPSGLASSRKA